MYPLQSGRESDPQSNHGHIQSVTPQQQRRRVGDEKRYAYGSLSSFSSSTHVKDAHVEGRFKPAPSSSCPPQRYIPAFLQPNQSYSESTGKAIHPASLNELAHEHNEYNLFMHKSQPMRDTHNLFQPPPFIGNYAESIPDPLWYHQNSSILQCAPQPYTSVGDYGFQNSSEFQKTCRPLSAAINRSTGRHQKLSSQLLCLDETSIEDMFSSREYGSVELTVGKSAKNKPLRVKNIQKEVGCTNINSKGFKEKENEQKNDKTPVPQNLRGDPFRSAKVKTELCRHYATEKGCPFGDKCNYAHGEHELKYTKLMDLDRAGLIDIEIYRTHPCPTWIATGACPFDSRCSGLHDPRIRGNSKSWLPHAETLMNRIGESTLNIDKLYHQRLSEVYSCSPIYGYVPLAKWSSKRQQTDFSWSHFYSYICNIDRPIHSQLSQANIRGNPEPKILEPIEKSYDKAQIFYLMITLKMRKNKLGQSFMYMPTHIFCGELCMIIQTRRYQIIEENTESSPFWQLKELSKDDRTIISGEEKPPAKVIDAYEIAFGPVYDPSARPLSFWFDIPSANLAPCTQKEAKNHKRSRHRLKKSRKKDKIDPTDKLQPLNDKTKGLDGLGDPTYHLSQYISFIHHQPVDQASFDLVTGILKHRVSALQFFSRKPGHLKNEGELNELVLRHQELKRNFESLRRFWVLWSWPINFMEDEIHDGTDVIPVDIQYRFDTNDRENFQSEALHGVTDCTGGAEIASLRFKVTVSILWESFLSNISERKQLEDVANETKTRAPNSFRTKLSRLPIFRHFSLGMKLNKNRNLSMLNQSYRNNHEIEMTILTICNEWETVEKHTFKKTHGSRVSNTSDTQERRATTPSIVSEESTDLNYMSTFDDCAF